MGDSGLMQKVIQRRWKKKHDSGIELVSPHFGANPWGTVCERQDTQENGPHLPEHVLRFFQVKVLSCKKSRG